MTDWKRATTQMRAVGAAAALVAWAALGCYGPSPAAAAERMVLAEDFTATW